VNIEKALATQGWMSETELRWLAETASRSNRIVEIGVYKGRSTCAIAGNTRGTVYSVDIWSECGTDGWYYDVFCANTAHLKNVLPVNRASLFAAREFAAKGKLFDMIFIDAAHDEYNVRQDLLAWRPLLRDGGVFCGHDYGFAGWPDVKRIVDELIPGVEVVDTIWIAPAHASSAVSAEQAEELDRRIAACERNPPAGTTWEEVKAGAELRQ
jgi:putative addiction module component (TIGR02574 family)